MEVKEVGKHRDWTEIRQEYEKGVSLQTLSERHDISIDTLKKASSRQKWVKGKPKIERLKKLAAEIAPNGTENGTEEKGTEQKAPRLTFQEQVEDAAHNLLRCVLKRLENDGDDISSRTIQELTSALKNIRQVTKDDLDREEQRARIEKLRAETKTEDAASRTVTVRFVDTEGGED